MKPESSTVRGRLAPSPTGALHLGNARSFLIAWLSARAQGGQVLLRMEDLDHPRVKPYAAAAAMADLRWLGLDWDEGPDCGGPHAPYVQSARTDRYAAILARLHAAALVYPCTCSRSDVAAGLAAPHPGDDGPRYPGVCDGVHTSYDAARAALLPGRLPAWRFRAPDRETTFTDAFAGPQRACVAREHGDFVLARHALGAGYMLAVVADDHDMGVTDVIRGDDLLAATHRQLLLHEALGWTPPRHTHVPLVVGPDGRRLAKRHGDTRILALRAAGWPPERVVGLLASWCGWVAPGVEITPADLLPLFDLATIPRRPVVLPPSIADAAPKTRPWVPLASHTG